jgi:hypothetical protein
MAPHIPGNSHQLLGNGGGPAAAALVHTAVENGLILRSVTSEDTSGLWLYPGSYEFRVTRTSGFRCANIELWEKV